MDLLFHNIIMSLYASGSDSAKDFCTFLHPIGISGTLARTYFWTTRQHKNIHILLLTLHFLLQNKSMFTFTFHVMMEVLVILFECMNSPFIASWLPVNVTNMKVNVNQFLLKQEPKIFSKLQTSSSRWQCSITRFFWNHFVWTVESLGQWFQTLDLQGVSIQDAYCTLA